MNRALYKRALDHKGLPARNAVTMFCIQPRNATLGAVVGSLFRGAAKILRGCARARERAPASVAASFAASRALPDPLSLFLLSLSVRSVRSRKGERESESGVNVSELVSAELRRTTNKNGEGEEEKRQTRRQVKRDKS